MCISVHLSLSSTVNVVIVVEQNIVEQSIDHAIWNVELHVPGTAAACWPFNMDQ